LFTYQQEICNGYYYLAHLHYHCILLFAIASCNIF